MSGCDGKTEKENAAYVPAERLFAMPLLESKADDAIDMVLRIGDKFKSIGKLDEAIATYEHFIKHLERFVMMSLSRITNM